MNTRLEENSAAAIWERAIQPEKADIEPAAARALLKLSFSSRDIERANELAVKAQKGTLTQAEFAELENYRTVGTAVGLIKAKARASLKKALS